MSRQNRGAVGAPSAQTFNNPSYKSTNVQFRGQDKTNASQLGPNPNAINVEEDYIQNL